MMWGNDRSKDLDATLAAMNVPGYRDTLSRLEAESIDRAIRQLVNTLRATPHFGDTPDSPFDRLEQTTKTMKANTQILFIRGEVAAHVRHIQERVKRKSEDQSAESSVAAFVKQIDVVIECVEGELR